MTGYTKVGKRLPAMDAVLKVTGEAKYGNDLILPQMLYGAMLRSPYPHARILNIDTSKAERLLGVKAIITGKDTAGMAAKAAPFGQKEYQEILAWDKVRFIGEPVAGIAAVDEGVAKEALELIQVEYETLPAVFDPEEAMKPDAPLIHEQVPNNIMIEKDMGYGDVDEGFQASHYIREDRFVTQRVYHGFTEPHVATASYDASGKLTLWASKMGLSRCLPAIVSMLTLNEGNVRVLKPYVGGAFGGKNAPQPHDVVAALLSIKTERPVKITLSWEEVFYNLCRAPVIINLKTGVKKDGALMAVECQAVVDSGAYPGLGMPIPFRVGKYQSIPYRLPHLKYKGYRVFTNNPVAGAFRGPGIVQTRFAVESQLDMLAEEIGIDPVELRIRNAMGPGETNQLEIRFISCGLKECIDKAAEAIGWREKRKRPGNRGVGMGTSAYDTGFTLPVPGFNMPYEPYWPVQLRLHEGGRVTMYTHSKDAGQGGDTILCQVVAEVLGILLGDVEIFSRDTVTMPLDRLAASNSDAYSGSKAVYQAATDLKRQIFEVVADKLECSPQDLEAKDGRIYVKGSPDKGLSFSEAALSVFTAKGPIVGKGSWAPRKDRQSIMKSGKGDTTDTYSFQAYGAEVEVDPETGKVKLLKIAGAYDCGFAINPMFVEGQIQGGIATGVGYAMTEEFIEDKEGRPLNPLPLDYRLLTALDLQEIEPILVETMDLEEGPYGAKECGEGNAVAAAPAIANAIYDAVGVRITSLPITPEKVLRALEEKGRRG